MQKGTFFVSPFINKRFTFSYPPTPHRLLAWTIHFCCLFWLQPNLTWYTQRRQFTLFVMLSLWTLINFCTLGTEMKQGLGNGHTMGFYFSSVDGFGALRSIYVCFIYEINISDLTMSPVKTVDLDRKEELILGNYSCKSVESFPTFEN